jgi:hypothetical protein
LAGVEVLDPPQPARATATAQPPKSTLRTGRTMRASVAKIARATPA